MKRLARFYARRARVLFLDRGLRGGDRFWLVFGGLFVFRRVLAHASGRVPQHLTTERLEPGHSVLVTAIPAPKGRRERKAEKRYRKALRAG